MSLRVRQLDLLLTVAAAVVVGTLGALDVVAPTVVAGATLTTLGLLALGSLRSRTAVHALTRAVADLPAGDPAGADRLLAPARPDAGPDLDRAADIRIAGVTLARTVRSRYTVLRDRLAAGATVRVVLIAPQPATVSEAARRSTVADHPEIFAHRLRPTLDLLDDLAARTAAGPGRLEVRLLDFVPAFGLVAADADTARGRMRVEVYSHRSGVPEPTLPLDAERDVHWFRHFADEFEQLWAAGRTYHPQTVLCQ